MARARHEKDPGNYKGKHRKPSPTEPPADPDQTQRLPAIQEVVDKYFTERRFTK